MSSNKILYICQEVFPYLPENYISSLCRFLPQVMQEQGNEIRIFMPRWGVVNERRNQLHEVIRLSGMNLIINDTDHQLIIKVASIPSARVQVYFIDNEDFFKRKATWSDAEGKFFDDNEERIIFFARGVLETVKKLRWAPSIVHCHDWFTAIAPIYLRRVFQNDPIFKKLKIVISIYDQPFLEPLNSQLRDKLVDEGVKSADVATVQEPTYANLMRMAIEHADAVVIASPEDKVDAELLAYINTLDKPVLRHVGQEEGYEQAYAEFYEKLNG